MRIGIPKEKRDQEYRVGATPESVAELIRAGHQVLVEKGAGEGVGASDEEYINVGAKITSSAEEVYKASEMVYKVKDPIEEEFNYFHDGLTIFCYLHLANLEPLADALLESNVTSIGYETIEVNGKLPLLNPMSEIGGCMAVHEGAILLTKLNGGKGKLLQGLPGVGPSHVVIVGGGVAGAGAVKTAVGIGSRVTVLDVNVQRLEELANIHGARIETLYSNHHNVAKAVSDADLLVGAVLVPGAKAPTVVTEEMVKTMGKGSVIVDISVDQGGCIETIDRMTTHSNPTYMKHDIIHYAVSNIPGTISMSATYALNNATIPYAMDLANKGWKQAAIDNPSIAKGINTAGGHIIHPAVAKAFDMEYMDVEELLK